MTDVCAVREDIGEEAKEPGDSAAQLVQVGRFVRGQPVVVQDQAVTKLRKAREGFHIVEEKLYIGFALARLRSGLKALESSPCRGWSSR